MSPLYLEQRFREFSDEEVDEISNSDSPEGSESPQRSDSPERTEDKTSTPNQQVSIRKLDIDKIVKGDQKSDLADLIKKVIAIYNKKIKKDPYTQDETVSKWDHLKSHNFKLCVYYRKTEYSSSFTTFLKAQGSSGDYITRKYDFLFFFYRTVEKTDEIFALTTGPAWNVLTNFTDFAFPRKITKRLIDPENIKQMHQLNLVGHSLQTQEDYRESPTIIQSDFFTSKVTSMVCGFKQEASIHRFLNSGNSVDTEIKMGSIRIRRRIEMDAFPVILDHLSSIDRSQDTFLFRQVEDNAGSSTPKKKRKLMHSSEGDVGQNEKIKEVDDPKFEFLDYIYQVTDSDEIEKLNRRIIDQFCEDYNKNLIPQLYLCHKYANDFFNSNHFSLEIRGRVFKKWDSCPTLEILVNTLRKKIKLLNFETFKKIKLGFNKQMGREGPSFLTSFLDGEVQTEEGCYFKARGFWYQISIDYLTLVTKDFRNLIKEHLIKSDDPAQLTLPWPKSSTETMYNQLYVDHHKFLDDPKFLVGDCITPNGIEIFDLLRYDDENNTWLYHNKVGFSNNTRVVCSQILNAAKVIGEARMKKKENHNVLKEFWRLATQTESDSEYRKKLKTKLLGLTEEKFYDLFVKNKVVFVLGFVDDHLHELKLIDEEKNFPLQLTSELIVSHNDYEGLKELKFIDKDGYRTHLCYSLTKKRFEELSQERAWETLGIYDKLKPSQSNSNIAKLELIQLKKELASEGYNYYFQICQIPRSSGVTELEHEELSHEENVQTVIQVDDAIMTEREESFTIDEDKWVMKPTKAGRAGILHALGDLAEEEYIYKSEGGKDSDKAVIGEFYNKLKSLYQSSGDFKKYFEVMMKTYYENAKNGNGKIIFESTTEGKEIALKAGCTDDREAFSRVFFTDNLLKAYKSALNSTNYFLSDDELELAAYLFDKQVSVFHNENGVYKLLNTFNEASQNRIVIAKNFDPDVNETTYVRCEIQNGS